MADTPKTGLSRSNRAEREPSQQEMQRRRQMQEQMEQRLGASEYFQGLENPETLGFMGRSIPKFQEQDRRNEMRQMQPPQLSAAQMDEARRSGLLGPAMGIE